MHIGDQECHTCTHLFSGYEPQVNGVPHFKAVFYLGFEQHSQFLAPTNSNIHDQHCAEEALPWAYTLGFSPLWIFSDIPVSERELHLSDSSGQESQDPRETLGF